MDYKIQQKKICLNANNEFEICKRNKVATYGFYNLYRNYSLKRKLEKRKKKNSVKLVLPSLNIAV